MFVHIIELDYIYTYNNLKYMNPIVTLDEIIKNVSE